MTLDEFVSRLEKSKKAGSGYTARCPAHDDRNASLSVTTGDDGRILVRCHAGCEPEVIVEALGLSLRDLFQGGTENGGGGRIEKTYDYVDEEGALLFQSVRLRDEGGRKTFRQRRPVGGGWEWKLGDVRRVLYRLPEIREAAGRAVWVVEGEKDVDALGEIGLPATCNPMGAGKWEDSYTESLGECAWVLVVADCDEPGRAHARSVAASVYEHGGKVKVLDLDTSRDDGYDVSDYVLEDAESASKRLRDLASTSDPWEPGREEKARAPVLSASAFRESVGEYDPSREYLGPFLYGGERVHVIGPVNHGKSTFVQEALGAALRGEEFLGWTGKGSPLTGVLIDLEQPAHKLHQGLIDARLYDPSLEGRFDVWHYPEGLAIDQNKQHREMLDDLASTYNIVVIDPWYKLVAEELSDGMRNVRPVISFLDGLRKKYTQTVIVLGRHTNEKEAGAKMTLADASGYKAYERASDVTLGFQRLGGDRSRLAWLKTRSHLLPKIGETWLVEWTQGAGFRRTERRRVTDEVEEFLTDEWQTTFDISESWGRSTDYASKVLNQLVAEDRAEYRGSNAGGRGQTKFWRLAHVDQGVIPGAEGAS